MSGNIVLIACGTFNPPTPMHFRMFEIARDHFRMTQQGNVIGGIVSPVHDSYNKPNVHIENAKHRTTMIKLSVLSSDWIRLSDWEMTQNAWTPTCQVLQYHQNHLNSILNDTRKHIRENIPSWAPTNIDDYFGQQVRIKLLCGADLLESFANRELWCNTDLETMLKEHGIVVIARKGSYPQKFIFESDLMFENQNNITIVENWIPNEISSTLARFHLRRGLSVKYLLNDDVIEYIHQRKLYETDAMTNRKRKSTPNPKPKHQKSTDTKQSNSEHSMDVTDNSPTKNVKPQQNDRIKQASKKRKYKLREKNKNRS